MTDDKLLERIHVDPKILEGKPVIRAIDWTDVNFLFSDHLGMTKNPRFSDNVLYLLLEDPRGSGISEIGGQPESIRRGGWARSEPPPLLSNKPRIARRAHEVESKFDFQKNIEYVKLDMSKIEDGQRAP